MKFKMTTEEKNWVLYDVGNSAFVLLVSTIIPIYFNYLAEKAGLSSVDYLAFWGYTASLVTIIVAFLGPVLGTLADTKDYKKPLFTMMLLIGCIGCFLLGFINYWFVFLIVFLIAKIGFSGSLIFYDSMLIDVTTPKRVDHVSSQGYAWGYIGSCVPFVICLGLVLGASKIGLSMEMSMIISFAIIALWWFCLTLPLLKTYKQKYYVERQPKAISNSFKRLGTTLKNIRKEKTYSKRYPTFLTVCIRSPASPNFLRNVLICISSVRDSPSKVVPHTRSIKRFLGITFPALLKNTRSSSNSLYVSSISSSST